MVYGLEEALYYKGDVETVDLVCIEFGVSAFVYRAAELMIDTR